MTTTKLITSRRGTVLVALAGTALAVTACGSSGNNSDDVDKAFIAKANAICAIAVAKHGDAKLPVANFDPEHPKASDLPAIGRYFATYGGASATAKRLDALPDPTKHADDWAQLRRLVNEAAANARRQITAAEHSDVAGFEKTLPISRSLGSRIDELGPKVGFGDSSPCKQVFG